MRSRTTSDHYRRGRFFNPGVPPQSFSCFLKWITHREKGAWPRFVDDAPGPRPACLVEGRELVVTFVNHSTFLLQTEGVNILTDPVWSRRASPVRFAGPRRHRNPGLHFEDLPPIDCLLISHNHYDHFDQPTLRRVAAHQRPTVFCPLGLEPLLRRTGFTDIHELDWWEHREWKGMDVHCIPAQHFSARTPFDRNRSLWCGWIVGKPGDLICFAGDTGFGSHFNAIAERFPSFRLALLPIGAFKPTYFMGPIHMGPAQAVEAQRILNAKVAIGSHYGTFPLADDSFTGPIEDLERALDAATPRPDFRLLQEGQSERL